jgi:hypothetical protein
MHSSLMKKSFTPRKATVKGNKQEKIMKTTTIRKKSNIYQMISELVFSILNCNLNVFV